MLISIKNIIHFLTVLLITFLFLANSLLLKVIFYLLSLILLSVYSYVSIYEYDKLFTNH
jgi:hypothetical protein